MTEIPRETIQRLNALKLGPKLGQVLDIIAELMDRKKPKGASLEVGWQPTRDDVDYGHGLGLDSGQIGTCCEEMRLWADANRNRAVARKADWSATFKNWMRRAVSKSVGKPHETGYAEMAEEMWRDIGARDEQGSNGNGRGQDMFPDAWTPWPDRS